MCFWLYFSLSTTLRGCVTKQRKMQDHADVSKNTKGKISHEEKQRNTSELMAEQWKREGTTVFSTGTQIFVAFLRLRLLEVGALEHRKVLPNCCVLFGVSMCSAGEVKKKNLYDAQIYCMGARRPVRVQVKPEKEKKKVLK